MEQTIKTKNEQETIEFAKGFLKKAQEGAKTNKPLIFYLTGELGAGKTHFVKGLAEELGITDNITSPTFVLMKKYEIAPDNAAQQAGKTLFFHIDCYRIYDAEDARQIGLDKVLENSHAVVAVEWAERIEEIVPKPYWKIKMEHTDDNNRKISVKNVQK